MYSEERRKEFEAELTKARVQEQICAAMAKDLMGELGAHILNTLELSTQSALSRAIHSSRCRRRWTAPNAHASARTSRHR